jgi:hypothetical protein
VDYIRLGAPGYFWLPEFEGLPAKPKLTQAFAATAKPHLYLDPRASDIFDRLQRE